MYTSGTRYECTVNSAIGCWLLLRNYTNLVLDWLYLQSQTYHFHGRKLRVNTHGHVLINMSISLLGLYVSFLIAGFTTGVPGLCGLVSALVQYFFLVFFAWTTAESIWLYLKLVTVFGSESFTFRYTLKSAVPAWRKSNIHVLRSIHFGCKCRPWLHWHCVMHSHTYILYSCCEAMIYIHCLIHVHGAIPYNEHTLACTVIPVLIVAVSGGAGHQFYSNRY